MTNDIPEGWYDDPAKPDMERWWTGSAWTDHVRYTDRVRLHAVAPQPEPIVPAAAMFSPPPVESYSAAGLDENFYVPMRTIQTRSVVRSGSASTGLILLGVIVVVGAIVGVALWLLLS